MEEVNGVSVAAGRCVDAGVLLLDLLLRTYSWLLRLLSAAASLHNTLPAVSASSLVEYWNFAVFSFLATTEAVSRAASSALHVVEGWLQTLGGVFESFKMVGHLSCHVALRTKELLHSCFLSGSCFLRQTCDAICIMLRLTLYFINTVVNIILIGTQNFLSVLAGTWEAVAGPVHRVVELALTALTFLYSSLVGASVLLWTPCQLLLDFLSALARVLVSVLVVDSRGLLVTAAAVSLALLVLSPRLPVLAGQLGLHVVNATPGARGVQMHIRRLHTVLLEQAPANQEVHTGTPQEVSGTDAGALIAVAGLPPTNGLSTADSPPLRTQQHGEVARTSTPEDGGVPLTDGELLLLLKEQEERKKCVICQDVSKTVLLLPCRHLCLCRRCADILTHRRATQRCCPLCRRDITQTMDVFL